MAPAAKNKKKTKVIKKAAKSGGVKKTKTGAAAKLSALPKAKVSVGAAVPAFDIHGTGGSVSLSGLRGKNVVLYFYPKDSTPGCTIEGRDFTRLHEAFRKANTEVFGVSRDSMKSHEKFKSKECYSLDLLSDEDEKLCRIFGVIKMKNMYGRQVRGIERSTFVIDANGRLIKEWRKVSIPGHADEVLEYVKSLG